MDHDNNPDGVEEEKLLSRRLLVTILVPVVLLVALAVVLGSQILRMTEDSAWVDHTDRVLSKVYDAQKEIVDQETAIRGYLLTEDRLFLEIYHRANPKERMRELEQLSTDNPQQLARIAQLRDQYDAWVLEAKIVVDGNESTHADARSLPSMLRRRTKMNAIREIISQIIATEEMLRNQRAAASAASTQSTRMLFVVLFVLTAGILIFFSRRQLQAIVGTYATALSGERNIRTKLEEEAWTRAGIGKINDAVQGDLTVEQLGDRVLSTLAKYVGADVGAFFFLDQGTLRRKAGFALDSRAAGPDTFANGEGLIGRAAQEKEVIRLVNLAEVPAEEVPAVRSGVSAERQPSSLVLLPAVVDGKCHGVIELGFVSPLKKKDTDLFERVSETIGVAIRSAEYRYRLNELLEESQRQAEELQTQQEELRVANEELEEHAKVIREAQARLEERQEELTTANAQLEEQSSALEAARETALEKAGALERAGRYKSEFVANMSHELRTPLNSSLILAKLLADNKEGNLTPEQIRFAQTIYAAGNDLLGLINDILDLSKIEAGKIDVNPIDVPLGRVKEGLERLFDPVAREKGITLTITIDQGHDTPASIVTDPQRLDQILKNLVSNAVKFTDRGGRVDVSIGAGAGAGAGAGRNIRFAVKDTGIGIAAHQQELVFEAFRQADSASTRKYGGTGLGLSISRDLARLLGGDIVLTSALGRGSTFVLTLPMQYRGRAKARPGPPLRQAAPPPAAAAQKQSALTAKTSPVADDRQTLDTARRVVLVIEDDTRFAEILVDLAHERGFQCIVAGEANEGFTLAVELVPSAIILDVGLPDHSGLSVLDRLKHTPVTRHIPVHVVTVEDHQQAALSMGAAAFLQKPVQRDQLIAEFKRLEERLDHAVRRLLIVEDDAIQRDGLTRLLASENVEVIAVGTAKEALSALDSDNGAQGTQGTQGTHGTHGTHGTQGTRGTNGRQSFDCIVTDLTLPDDSGLHLLEQMAKRDGPHPPVIVYTGRTLSEDEEQALRRYSSSIIVKGARSPERLLDEVTLFLHQVESQLPPDRQKMLREARDREELFDGRTILVVEDDVRNIFALSSILEPKGAKVIVARNGREALTMLEKTMPNVDLVLMDIMMPEMDGLTAMQEIRKRGVHSNHPWTKLPIIALTAKAMRDDQEKCMKAGANDYISKPLDVEMLLSLLRVWMPQRQQQQQQHEHENGARAPVSSLSGGEE